MAKIQRRSAPIDAPKMLTAPVGNDEVTVRGCAPKISVMSSWAMTKRAKVATILIKFEAFLSWRISRK